MQKSQKALLTGIITAFAMLGSGYAVQHRTPLRIPGHLMKGIGFAEVTDVLGIKFNFEYPDFDRYPAEDESVKRYRKSGRRMYVIGPGISIADVNADGYMDFYVVTGLQEGSNILYLGNKDGGFTESAEQWGVQKLNDNQSSAISSIFFDYNRDGKPDLFVAGLGCSHLLRNDGGGFTDVSAESGVTDCKNSQGAVPFDLEGDGDLDLYVFRYFADIDLFDLKNESVWRENDYDARNGGQDSVYQNNGNGTFTDITESAGFPDTHWTLDAGIADFDNDGALDLYVAHDYGPDLLFAIKNGKLENRSELLGVPDRRFGMNVSLADIKGDGFPEIYVSNVYLDKYRQQGNFVWSFRDKTKGADGADNVGLHNCLWAWGAGVGDFDHDGNQDMYVANGMVSPPKDHPEMVVNANYNMSVVASLPGVMTTNLTMADKIGILAPNQTDCVFYNRGGHFENVSDAFGITDIWDGRAVGMIDYDNNGSLDLIVTTGNGPLHFFRNRTEPEKRWVGFSLKGTRSNIAAQGSRIELIQDGKHFYRWGTGGKSGFLAISDPRIHFGLPKEGPVTARIKWPDGKVQELANLESGKYYDVVEP